MEKTNILKIVIKERNRKPIYKITKELLHCFILEKEVPYFYFTSLLYKENTGDYRNFIGHKKLSGIMNKYFSKGHNESLENKLEFENILNASSVNTPKTLAYNVGYTLHIDKEEFFIKNESELLEIMNNLISMSKKQSIFVKLINGSWGKNAYKFTGLQKRDNTNVSKLFSLLNEYSFIFQETIIQHDAINELYENSINTIRVNAFYDRKNNQLKILSALMRLGVAGSVVDNISVGGFFVPINIKTWRIDGIGRSFLQSGGRLYTHHPDSNKRLNNFQIPFSEMIEQELYKAAPLFEVDLLGWDIAITDDGPLIIEANQDVHLGMAQMACGGFKSHKAFKQILHLNE